MHSPPVVVLVLALSGTASAAPENVPHAFSASIGGSASPSGGFLSTISGCNDRASRYAWFKTTACTSFQLGRDPDEHTQGDLVFEGGVAFAVTPWLEVRGLMGISASSPFELLAHGLVWALDDKDHTDETYVPWVATQLSGAIAVRANLDWGFVELGGSYHRHYEGSGLEWAQPSGAFVGLSVGIMGAMHVDPPEPPPRRTEPEPILPPGPTTI